MATGSVWIYKGWQTSFIFLWDFQTSLFVGTRAHLEPVFFRRMLDLPVAFLYNFLFHYPS
jgi:hypothetical protein